MRRKMCPVIRPLSFASQGTMNLPRGAMLKKRSYLPCCQAICFDMQRFFFFLKQLMIGDGFAVHWAF